MDNEVLISEHIRSKEDSKRFKERRFGQWNENYALYRDKVSTNRLTQRQPINIPIVRETIQTWISKIDESPKLRFEARDQGSRAKTAEIIFNEIYNYYYDKLKLDVLDNLDKKIAGLQGRSFKKIGVSKREVFIDIVDPYDIEIDPRCNPLDIESAAWLIHTHIYRSLKQILADNNYTEEGKSELKQFLDSKQGLIKAATDLETYERRKERLVNLGVNNFDEYRASDVLLEINESYKMVWHDKEKKFIRHLITIANDSVVLNNKPIKECIGIDRLPFVSWAPDPDLIDFWSDGIADSVRTFNKVTNMYISQDLENRTYRNFGMYFFNTLNGTFQPRGFEAKPFGMYGVPGNPAEVVKQMDIQPLSDTMPTISWLKDMIQSSVAQTPLERGEQQKGNSTLGEVQLSFQQSSQRNTVVSKNYRRAWKELGELFYDLFKANITGSIKLFKKGGDGNYYEKDAIQTDWLLPKGYEVVVQLQAERDAASDFDLKKIQYVKNSFANNPTAINIAKKKELELLDWTDDEINAVMQAENPQAPLNVMQDAPTAENNPQDSVLNTNKKSLTGGSLIPGANQPVVQ